MSDPNQPHEPHGRHSYDPTQPRVPAGQSTGGQWTDTDGPNVDGASRRKVVRDTSGQEAWNFYYNMYRPDGSLAEQVVFNRDRSRIVSEYNEAGGAGDWDERHTVITPDGSKFTFEDRGDNQIAYDGGDGRPSETASTEHGSEERPIVQKAFLPAVAAPAIIGVGEGIGIAAAGLALLTWLSRRNRREGTYVLSFPANLLQRADAENLRRVQVTQLTEDELNKTCKEYGNVQKWTNKAAADARREPRDWRPSSFGTEVHKRVAHIVNSGSDEEPVEPRSPNEPKNRNFRAEMSALKVEAAVRADAARATEAGLGAETVKPGTDAPVIQLPGYGQPHTVRVDVFENRPDERTVCLYDIKTGERLLYFPRMKEIARAVFTHYPNARRIIVAEIRPR
jgi:hypothetical protein